MKMMNQAQIVKHKIKHKHKNTYFLFNTDRIRSESQHRSLTLAGADSGGVA